MLIIRNKPGTTKREQYTRFGWVLLSKRRFTKAMFGRRMMYFVGEEADEAGLKRLLDAQKPGENAPITSMMPQAHRHAGYSRADYERDLGVFEQMEMALSAEILKAESARAPLLPGVIFGVQAEIDALRRKAKARLLIGRMRAMDKEFTRRAGRKPTNEHIGGRNV